MSDKAISIPGWFLNEEGLWYRETVANNPHGLIVEVGCWLGRSTSFLAPVLAHQPQRLVCVDHFAGSTDRWNPDYLSELDRAERQGSSIRSQFESNMRDLNIPYTLLTMSSAEAAVMVKDASAALVFLDASHDAAAIADDLRRWHPKVHPHGILAGHDYGIEEPDVVAEVHRFGEESKLTLHRGPGTIFYFEVGKR